MGGLFSKITKTEFTSSNKTKIGGGNTLEMTNTEVRNVLKNQLNQPNCPIFINDRDYIALDEGRLKDFTKNDKTDKLTYKSERSDCDDFTRVFLGQVAINVFTKGSDGNRGLAIGEVQGELYKDGKMVKHSMVIVVVNDGGKAKVKLFEPQNDKFYSIDERNKYWFVHV